MEKLLTPPPPSVSLNFTSFSRTVGCMLLASFNKNVNFSYVFVIFNETFYGIFQTWSPKTYWPILGCPFVFFNNFPMLPFSFQTFLLGCNSEGLKELSWGSESAKIQGAAWMESLGWSWREDKRTRCQSGLTTGKWIWCANNVWTVI